MEFLILLVLFLLVVGLLSIDSKPKRYTGGTIWVDLPPIIPLTQEEAENLLLPPELLGSTKKQGETMPKFTPQQLLTRAGHRHPDDIIQTITQEYDIVPKGTENTSYQKFVEELNGPSHTEDEA